MRVEAPPLGGWEASKGIQNLEPITPDLQGVHLRLPGWGDAGPTLEIYSYAEMADKLPTFPNRMGYGHLAFEVADVAETLQKLLQNGGDRLGEISGRAVEGVGYITFVYAKDPEGNIIEIQNWC